MSRQPLTTYLKLCTEFYDLELDKNKDLNAFSFYTQYADQAHGAILEPMCGTGRFLIPLLEAGFNIEGFDASPHMLNALIQKYAAISDKKAPVWQEFVQDFKRDKKYQLIFIPFGSWGLITDRANAQKGLEALYHHLLPGGKLVLEIETIASAPKNSGIWCRGTHIKQDNSLIAVNTLTSYQPNTQLFSSICRYEQLINNEIIATETEDFQQYLYRFNEIEKMLTITGFSEIKKYQDYAKNPAVDLQSPILFYECLKD